MAIERHIVSQNQARDYLGIGRASTEWDTFFMGDATYFGAIELASVRIEGFIENKVKLQEITNLIVDGSGYCEQPLPWYPISQISGTIPGTPDVTKLQYRDSVSGGWVDLFTSLANLQAYLHIDTIKHWRLEILDDFQTFPYGRKNIKVSYWAGYETIPGDIITVCLEMIADLRNQFNVSADGNTGYIGKGRLGLSSQSDAMGGGSSTTSYLNMTDRWAKMLQPYRKLVP